MSRRILLCVLAMMIPTVSVWAVKVSSLYQAEIPVASQAADARADAIREAFHQILIKVSSNQDIDKNALIKSSLKKADYYVQEYSYSAPTVLSSTYLLIVKFDQEDVNRLLRKAGVSYWGETRPLLLVWLAVSNQDQQSEIVGGETPGEMLETMKQQGKRYGLPLIFPVMDMTDMSHVTPADVSSMAIPVLKEAGKRYTPDALLVGEMQPAKDGYVSKWTLVLNNNQWNWEIPGATPEIMMADILHEVSQTLSKRYSEKTVKVQDSWVTLEVTNVSRDHDLEQLMNYLKQLTPVQQVQLSKVSSDSVELSVLVRGTLDTFEENATIGQKLVLKSQDENAARLVYEWVH